MTKAEQAVIKALEGFSDEEQLEGAVKALETIAKGQCGGDSFAMSFLFRELSEAWSECDGTFH